MDEWLDDAETLMIALSNASTAVGEVRASMSSPTRSQHYRLRALTLLLDDMDRNVKRAISEYRASDELIRMSLKLGSIASAAKRMTKQ